MLHGKWCCICNMFCLRLTMSAAPVSSFLFRAISVAALSTHCKIYFFWEVLFERRHLVALNWCPSFFSMAVFWRWRWTNSCTNIKLYVVSPLVNESALAENIVTQLIHALEWLRRLHWNSDRSSREFATSLALVCSFVVAISAIMTPDILTHYLKWRNPTRSWLISDVNTSSRHALLVTLANFISEYGCKMCFRNFKIFKLSSIS